MKRRIAAFLVFAFFVATFCTFFKFEDEILNTTAKSENKTTVIIDAGHGGLTNTID